MTTASEWDDARTFALARKNAAERYEANVDVPSQLPDHGPSRDRLLRGLRLAARFTADVWDEYATDATVYRDDAGRHEMERADSAEERERLHAANRARYDIPAQGGAA